MNNSITLDSTNCRTTLCELCVKFGTDKSPYTGGGGHRHPYTAPYSLLFEPLRNRPIKFVEIGIFRGASILVWRYFFSRARIYGFDKDCENMEYIRAMNLPAVYLDRMDAADPVSMNTALMKHMADGELFDVILDDAAHNIEQQAVTIRNCLSKLKQGGLLIIEDVFREQPEEPYINIMNENGVKELISFSTFIVCDHKDRYSPGWNNDKMLVIVRA
jgi:predicted O-methyltransferase YrrM